MVPKYFDDVIPNASVPQEIDRRLREVYERVLKQVSQHMEDLAFNKALGSLWEFINACNKYIDESAPWTLAKAEKDHPRLGTVLYNALEGLRLVALPLAAFMPSTSEKMWSQLGLKRNIRESNLGADGIWGGLKSGGKVLKPAPLFPRLDPIKIRPPLLP